MGTRVGDLSASKQHYPESKSFKVIIIGSTNVGKTCLACVFSDGAYPDSPESTIGVDFKEKKVVVEGEVVKLQLWDTAGQERFRQSMTTRYYRSAHAMVIVYDITNMESFRQCHYWLEEAKRFSGGTIRVAVLVGNKTDCPAGRVVTTRMGSKFAEANNLLFFETSAKNLQEVNRVFFTVAAKLRSQAVKDDSHQNRGFILDRRPSSRTGSESPPSTVHDRIVSGSHAEEKLANDSNCCVIL